MNESQQRRTTDTGTSPAQAREVSLLAGLLGFVAVYVALHALRAPWFYYVPTSQLWTAVPPAGAPAMGYYGLLLPATLAFGALFTLARFFAPHARQVLARIAMFVVPLTLLYFVWAELIERI